MGRTSSTRWSRPARDAAVNVLGSVNVFSAARAVGARRVVKTSTGGAIDGETDVVPTSEKVPADPVSPYGLSKLTAERYASWFRRMHGLDIVTLRYGNVYGPRQDPGGDAGVIAIFCDRVLAGRRPTIYGDGRQTCDYVFVGDIAVANRAAARAGELPHGGYNVGTGTESSVLELAEAVAIAADVAVGRPWSHPGVGPHIARLADSCHADAAMIRKAPRSFIPMTAQARR